MNIVRHVQTYVSGLRLENIRIWWRHDMEALSVGIPLSKDHYNMTVWILARKEINFSMAAGLIRLHMPGVKESRV